MTNKDKPLSIQVDSKQLDAFCKKIISRSRNTANIHEALTVLEAFVSTFSFDSQGSESYRHIQQILKSHSAKTRDKLMQERTSQLEQGLLDQNRILLADVYGSLSRNGFYQNLTAATDNIEPSKIPPIAGWVIQWADEARQKAEQASGYPDALDFTKANIKIDQYQAMTDIAYFFKHTFKYE